MAIRITGGQANGRVLHEPVGSGVRPTSSRVREALFSMIGQDLAGVRVLDAFGGSGLVGLEAWSRGAEVTVVERDRRAFAALVRRGQEIGARWNTRNGDVMKLIDAMDSFDGIFCDPPYDADPMSIVPGLAPRAREWLVYEARKGVDCPEWAAQLKLDRRRDYGSTALWIYRPPPVSE